MLRLGVQRVPRIIVVRREHMTVLDAAGEIVMAVQVQFVVNRDEPGTTAGTARHVAGNGDHQAARVLPAFAGGTRACLASLTIEGIPGRVAIGVEG